MKALTLSQAVICGGIFAGCNQAPGDVMGIDGKIYKQYRGMGSLAAMKVGSAARYGQPVNPTQKVAAEGIRRSRKRAARWTGAGAAHWRHPVRHGLSWRGGSAQLRDKARYIRVSPAGMRQAAPHDVVELKTGN